jgi:TRAP-type C4-dicarboxylate transport system substrate-binding protein
MRIGSLLSAFVLGAVLSSAASAQEFKLRFATSVANTQEPSYKEMEAFAQRVKQRSGGRLDLQLFPGEQLGAQKKVNEMISLTLAYLPVPTFSATSIKPTDCSNQLSSRTCPTA